MKYDDGVVFICELRNVAPNGYKPELKMVKINKHWFGERTIGYNRQYLAKGVNEQVDMLIRIHHDRNVRIGMHAMLGNGDQFLIDNVQHLFDEENLRCTDLTLRRLEKNYELAVEN